MTKPPHAQLSDRQRPPTAAGRILDRRDEIALRGRLVSVEVARPSGRPASRLAAALSPKVTVNRWQAVEAAWRSEMRRLIEAEAAPA